MLFLKSKTATGNLSSIIIFNDERVHNTFDFHFFPESSQTISFYSFLKFIEIISQFCIPQFVLQRRNYTFFIFIFSISSIVPVIFQILNKCMN